MIDSAVGMRYNISVRQDNNAVAVLTAATRHSNCIVLGLERPCRISGVCLGGQRDYTARPFDVNGTEVGVIKFSPRLSLWLDRATVNTEAGSKFWKTVKRFIEWVVFQ